MANLNDVTVGHFRVPTGGGMQPTGTFSSLGTSLVVSSYN